MNLAVRISWWRGVAIWALLSVAADVRAQTLDAFDPGADGTVYAIAIQPDNKILVGGSFTAVGSTNRQRVARLLPDGSVDPTFDPQAIFSTGTVSAIAIQPDGKILVGGTNTANGKNIVRLTTTGALDPTFDVAAGAGINAIVLQPDGKILIGGSFTTLQRPGSPAATRRRIGRLNADGSVDPSFDPGADGSVFALALQSDGKVVVGGTFAMLGGGTGTITRNLIGRVDANGIVDPGFNPGAGSPAGPAPFISSLVLQPDGKVLVGGRFKTLGGGGTGTTSRYNLGRLKTDGSIDDSFVPPSEPVNPVASAFSQSIVVLPNRKVLVGGFSLMRFSDADTLHHLIRLNSSGTIDPSFAPRPDFTVEELAVDLDGKIVVGGAFGTIGASGRSRLARLDLRTRLFSPMLLRENNTYYDAKSVAISSDGKTAIVSDPYDNAGVGAAWIWTRDADAFTPAGGVWTTQAKLVPSQFGFAEWLSELPVALSADGNTAVVGMPNWRPEVVVFTREWDEWSETARLSPPPGPPDFSDKPMSIDISGDGNTLIMGTPRDDDSRGAAWVWVRSGNGWTQQGFKLVGDAASGGQFSAQGSTVALSGDGNTAVVGGDGSSGGVWVWTRNAGVWTQQGQKLFTVAVASVSVSADGNTLVAGIPNDNNGEGAAWVFTRNGAFWSAQAKLVATDAVVSQSSFPLQGNAVSLSPDGRTALIAGRGDDNYRGAAWIWKRGAVWTQEPKLVGSRTVNAGYGYSVGVAGDGTLIIAEPFKPYGASWVSTAPRAEQLAFAATTVTTTSATVRVGFFSNGTPTTGMIEYGPSGTYGTSIWVNPESDPWLSHWLLPNGSYQYRDLWVDVTRTITGLMCGTEYHFRAVASSGDVSTYSADRTFTTVSCGPTVATQPATNISWNAATLNGTVNPNGHSTTFYFDYGVTNVYGSSVSLDAGSGNSVIAQSANVALACGTTYHYRARAQNTAGTATGANQPFTTAPCAPAIGAITPGDAQITVAFTAGADGGIPITNYKYSTNAGATWIARSPAQTASPLVIGSLINGTTYTVQLRAVNAIGDGAPSAPVTASPFATPAAPTITVTPGNRQLTVAVTAGANGGSAITNYEYSTNAGATWTPRSPAGTTSPIVIGGLINGTAYQVQVRATNAAGPGAASATVPGTPSTTPDAPLISGVEPGNSQLTVVFAGGNDGGRPITNYSYSTDGGATWIVRSPAATGSPLVITKLVNGTTYQVQLRAANDNGDGAPSVSVQAAPALSADEAVDAFNPAVDGAVHAIAVQPHDGKIVVGGAFMKVGVGGSAVARQKIARFHADGSLDTSFDPGANIAADSTVTAIAVQPDGKIVVASSGEDPTIERRHIGRLHGDGSLDQSFDFAGANDHVLAIAVQVDPVAGTLKILVGGTFTKIGRQEAERSRNRIGRFNADGTVDDSFNPGADGSVHVLAVQADGSILVGGSFMRLGSDARLNIGRLTATGSLDTGFNPGAGGGADPVVRAIRPLPDGDIIVAGRFTTLGGATRHNVGRLNANGSLDAGFDPGPGATASSEMPLVESVAALPDGRILVGGFAVAAQHSDLMPRHLARLYPNGTLDADFEPRPDARVNALVRQSDGKILVGGRFTTIGGAVRSRLARLGAPTSSVFGVVPAPFADDPLVSGVTVLRAVHIVELRERIHALRQRFGLAPVAWTDPILTGVPPRAVHIQQLREALLAAYDFAFQQGVSAAQPVFADNPLAPGASPIRRLHVEQLRAAVRALEASS